MPAETPFLDQLNKSKKSCGDLLFLFENYLTEQEASDALEIMNSDQFPWNLKPTLYGVKLEQHSYTYSRSYDKNKSSPGLKKLEEICQKIETEFDGTISDVFCNRFQDPNHRIPWHKDTFGCHILVLSLGRDGKVQFRDNKTKQIEEICPRSGDLYFMPLRINDTHKHQVCPGSDDDDGGDGIPRLSFVFFFKTPKYAKEYKITKKDKVKGFFESMMA